MKHFLGAFEEIILLAIGSLEEGAYGVSIKKAIEFETGKKPSVGALHTALIRLEGKGLVTSKEGGATNERGGRRKRFYQLTIKGRTALIHSHEIRNNLISKISEIQVATQKILK